MVDGAGVLLGGGGAFGCTGGLRATTLMMRGAGLWAIMGGVGFGAVIFGGAGTGLGGSATTWIGRRKLGGS